MVEDLNICDQNVTFRKEGKSDQKYSRCTECERIVKTQFVCLRQAMHFIANVAGNYL